ncbi:response regulator [Allostella sp. ATCC 35155]|nr:response regulator [Stella sp. ATCC 35155]
MPSNILIVEDEWLIAEDYASTLHAAGHAVVGPCSSVKAAIATIEQNPVDAALLDMELLGERSFPVAEFLQARGIPFTFFSGHGTRDLPPAISGHAVLSKPISGATLLEAVERMCPAA